MPRASAEYRWVCAQTITGNISLPPRSRTSSPCRGSSPGRRSTIRSAVIRKSLRSIETGSRVTRLASFKRYAIFQSESTRRSKRLLFSPIVDELLEIRSGDVRRDSQRVSNGSPRRLDVLQAVAGEHQQHCLLRAECSAPA